jgi:hypothetical protein
MLNDVGTNGAHAGEEARLWVRSLAFTQRRQQAVDALLRMGTAAIAALEEARGDSNNRVREEAAAVLERMR